MINLPKTRLISWMRPKQFKEMFLSAFSQIKDTCDHSDKLQRKIQS